MTALVSLWPKVVVTATASGHLRGSCSGCGTAAVITSVDCVDGFKRRHERCQAGERS